MKFILIYTIPLLFFSQSITKWEPGKIDSDGDLIIVELSNKQHCKDRPRNEVVVVDADWSVLLLTHPESKTEYYIFNNQKKKIFKTESFDNFIDELKKIPNNTMIRQIEKCTISFSYLETEKNIEVLKNTIEEKHCTLESRIMFCYCCAEKVKYEFK